MSDTLRTKVRVAFALNGKNQKWLAREIGINESQLSDILNGKRHGKKTNEYIEAIKNKLHIEDAEKEVMK